MASFQLRQTANGFYWGPLEVICEAEHEHAGVMLALETARERVEIRVTPKGFIRLGTVARGSASRPLPGDTADAK
jgi:hypothetical protein